MSGGAYGRVWQRGRRLINNGCAGGTAACMAQAGLTRPAAAARPSPQRTCRPRTCRGGRMIRAAVPNGPPNARPSPSASGRRGCTARAVPRPHHQHPAERTGPAPVQHGLLLRTVHPREPGRGGAPGGTALLPGPGAEPDFFTRRRGDRTLSGGRPHRAAAGLPVWAMTCTQAGGGPWRGPDGGTAACAVADGQGCPEAAHPAGRPGLHPGTAPQMRRCACAVTAGRDRRGKWLYKKF